MSAAKVFVSQRNFAVGDLAGNRALLAQDAKAAGGAGAKVLLSPELSLTGYSPEDLLHDSGFVADARKAAEVLAGEIPAEVATVAGLPWAEDGALFNAAAVLRGGRIESIYRKNFLPNYSVFDERRHFEHGTDAPLVFDADGTKFAVQICHDIWAAGQAARVGETGADVVLCPNASPYYWDKHRTRIAAARGFAREARAAVVYAHGVGGQDELVFDGGSFAVSARGEATAQFPFFAEHGAEVFAEGDGRNLFCAELGELESLRAAVVLSVRDFAAKNGFGGALLGLSGGVDSAVAAVLAAEALGGANVTCVMMPSRHTSRASLEDAAAVARNIGAEYFETGIDESVNVLAGALSGHLKTREGDTTMENLQARARGVLLMALANNGGRLLLATGNKSEFACGYATLYGDMCGGFAPLKDLSKTRVWRLAEFCNRDGELIPRRVIERAPTAELRENQTDQDTLPPYDEIDAAVEMHLNGAAAGEMEGRFGGDFLLRFHGLLKGGEHKRRQAAVGPKLTERAFGRDWRMPVANRYWHK